MAGSSSTDIRDTTPAGRPDTLERGSSKLRTTPVIRMLPAGAGSMTGLSNALVDAGTHPRITHRESTSSDTTNGVIIPVTIAAILGPLANQRSEYIVVPTLNLHSSEWIKVGDIRGCSLNLLTLFDREPFNPVLLSPLPLPTAEKPKANYRHQRYGGEANPAW